MRLALRSLTIAAVVTTGAIAATPARSQQSAAVRLTAFPPSVSSEGSLRIGLDVRNTTSRPMTGLRVSIAIHEAINTRYRLERSFNGTLGPVVGSDTFPVEGEVEPGSVRNIGVEKPISEISFLRSTSNDRAYPVRITVRSGRAVLGSVDSYMVHFKQAPQVPLGISVVVPLHAGPMYTRASMPSTVSNATFERAVTHRLDRVVRALEAYPDLPITIAPSGLLLDQLADLADGYERLEGRRRVRVAESDPRARAAAALLERIAAVASRPATKVIVTPYSMAPLAALSRADLQDRAQAQVSQGISRTEARLGKDALIPNWLFPGQGNLDEPTVSAIQRVQIQGMVLAPGSLRESDRALTRGTPATIRTRTGGAITSLIRDGGLERHLATAGISPVQARQRLLADSAIAMLERPSQSRVVTFSTPVEWNPEEAEAPGLFGSLSSSVWIKPATPETAVEQISAPASPAELAPPDTSVRGVAAPDPDYLSALAQARVEIDRFSELGPPPARLAAMEQRLLIAEAGDNWPPATSDRGRDMARSIEPYVRAEFEKIKAPSPQTITLTSQNGVIPLLISSSLDYPANVVVRLDSDKLRFPDGERLVQKLQPPNQQIEVKTIARATGTFPLRVIVETPESGVAISSTRLVIRSTDYNVVAVAITAGAAIFLVGFWVIGAARRRLAPG